MFAEITHVFVSVMDDCRSVKHWKTFDLAAETCKDKIQNQDETDVDCGGNQCPKCGDMKICNDDCDCISGSCKNNTCFREYPRWECFSS